MNIEITGETEQLIRAAIAAGRYASAEEVIVEMVKRYKDVTSHSILPMPKRIDLDAMAAAQGVGPIQDFRELEADFWPEGESMEDFLSSINEIRNAG